MQSSFSDQLAMKQYFPNLVHFWAQKVDYLKNYITYEGKILVGLYLWFFGSEFFFVKIGAIIKKLISPYKSSSEMWYNILLLLIYIWSSGSFPLQKVWLWNSKIKLFENDFFFEFIYIYIYIYIYMSNSKILYPKNVT